MTPKRLGGAVRVLLVISFCFTGMCLAEQEYKVLSKDAKALTGKMFDKMQKDFESVEYFQQMQNAVTEAHIDKVARNRSVVSNAANTFSIKIDSWKVTNQHHSGRCWLFAGLNFLRAGAMEKMNIEDFEFSQSYLFFWDKMERANYFLESIIDTAELEDGNRTVDFILANSLGDGGQWNMFVSLVKKHGLVPKFAMPESFSSSNSKQMNYMLRRKLHEGAKNIRDEYKKGADRKKLEKIKDEYLNIIYRMLCIHMGTPPKKIFWQWRDKDDNFHRDGEMTPRQFAEKYVTVDLDDYVCLVHDPREKAPYGTTMTISYLGNVIGGEQVKYLNVEIGTIRKMALETLKNNEPVWFGCDVGKLMSSELGLLYNDLYDYEGVYNTTFELNKTERLLYHQTMMTHAMVFTGVDVVKNQPTKWRVENSWGDKNGKDGYYIMNDAWFDEYMFEVAVKKSILPKKLQQASETEPIVLPPWDPMGALAR